MGRNQFNGVITMLKNCTIVVVFFVGFIVLCSYFLGRYNNHDPIGLMGLIACSGIVCFMMYRVKAGLSGG
jgi:ABC-type transport system involved in cytochrome c biogenesis permease subunit